MRRLAWPLVSALLLAGCLADVPAGPGLVEEEARPSRPHVVLGVVDDGINPYHLAFRAAGPEAYAHPSTYLPGYPATALALRLTLNATFEEARAADEAIWGAVEDGTLYWIPGTRIVAYYRAPGAPSWDEGGFGTAAAGRAAGNGTSLAPQALLAVAAGAGPEAVAWATGQEWLDLLLVGWNTQRPPAVSAGVAAPLAAFAATRPLVVAAGNGLASPAGAVGGAGLPALLDGTAGVPGALSIGGHDNGRPTPWTGTIPHAVADVRGVAVPSAAHHADLAPVDARAASGTTVSAGWVAGAAARILLEARVLAGDLGIGLREAMAIGNATAAGPLADGRLDLAELRALLLHTADPSVAPSDADGAEGASEPGRPTLPVAWSQLPPGAWRYALVGYGAVTEATTAQALAALRGEAELAEREEDAWAEQDAALREALGRRR